MYMCPLWMYHPLNCYFNSIGSVYLNSQDKPFKGDCDFVSAFVDFLISSLGRRAGGRAVGWSVFNLLSSAKWLALNPSVITLVSWHNIPLHI